jgi:hypothetical protein
MKRFFKIAALASALLVATGAVAMASSTSDSAPGRLVPVTQDIKDFFAARGIDASYLGAAPGVIPTADWQKLLRIVNTPDDTSVTTDDHDVLNSMVLSALLAATTTTDDPVYMDLGNNRWIYEQDSDSD